MLSSIEHHIVPAIRGNSRKLNFSCKNLKYLPKSIGRVESCEKLQLQSNLLDDLPPEISYLHRVSVYAMLAYSSLTDQFNHLFKLIFLNIGNNLFEDLPECLFNLKNLQTLLVYQNKLKYLNLGVCCK